MKILQIVTSPTFAGIERYVVETSNELSARGHAVQVIGGDPRTMRDLLAPAVGWSRGSTTRDTVWSLLKAGRQDVVHTHLTKSDFLASAFKFVNRASLISTRHIVADRGWSPIARRLSTLVRRRLDVEISVSKWTSENIDHPSDLVVLNGVKVLGENYAADPSSKTVLILQRLAPEKETDVAIRAWHASGLGEAGWTLRIGGRGEELASLTELVSALNLQDSVEFLGWVDDVDAIWRDASVMLAPAANEPCGLSIIEAMARGGAVIASGSGGNLETLGRVQGAMLFPPGDHLAAAAHLRSVASDELLRATYGHISREHQRANLSLGGHVDKLEAVYRNPSL